MIAEVATDPVVVAHHHGLVVLVELPADTRVTDVAGGRVVRVIILHEDVFEARARSKQDVIHVLRVE